MRGVLDLFLDEDERERAISHIIDNIPQVPPLNLVPTRFMTHLGSAIIEEIGEEIETALERTTDVFVLAHLQGAELPLLAPPTRPDIARKFETQPFTQQLRRILADHILEQRWVGRYKWYL